MNDYKKLTLSYSKISCFLGCRKRYDWVYNHNLVPVAKSRPLQVGDITHQLLDIYYRSHLTEVMIAQLPEYIHKLYPNSTKENCEEVAIEAVRLVSGYIHTFQKDDLKVVSPEMWLEKDFGDFILTARLDALCLTPDNRKWRMEHKTTSKIDSFFLQGLRSGLQTGIAYWLMKELLPDKFSGTIFNMLVKTKIPQFPRQLVLLDSYSTEYAEQTVYGVYNSIARGHIYPSMNCFQYGGVCDYEPLCRSYTDNTVSMFYQKREEVQQHQKSLDLLNFVQSTINL